MSLLSVQTVSLCVLTVSMYGLCSRVDCVHVWAVLMFELCPCVGCVDVRAVLLTSLHSSHKSTSQRILNVKFHLLK